jgi:pyruvate dehydrogenase E2 component (dihydrolipoamide acetyltransferase)
MQQNPHYFVASSISVSKLLKLREALNASADGAYKLSVNDLLVKALAVAARKVPAANSSWREIDGKVIIRQHNVVDVSVAVSTPVGLMTPIVKNVNGLGLSSISAQIKDLGKRARDGSLKLDELAGGTFSITNGGVYGSLMSTPILNPPQSAILGMHKIQERPIAVKGQVVIRPMMYLALSYDHRIVDGKEAVSFLVRVKEGVEDPRRLLLGL